MKTMRKAFTLMEVNLAIFIMATGVLSMVSLYSLGFRENSQSVEDVAAASFADAYLAPLISGLSATNMTWSAWCQIGSEPSGDAMICDGVTQNGRGWAAYINRDRYSFDDGKVQSGNFHIVSTCNSLADSAYNEIARQVPSPYTPSQPSIDRNYFYGLVATRRGGTISLAFRASKRRDALMSQPLYYTEVHFQGRTDL